jgi:hypothetical protein
MTKSEKIRKYNEYLIINLIKNSLIVYFNTIHEKYYNYIDISFMEFFLELNDHDDDECFIHHKYLKTYNVIQDIKSSDKVSRYFNKHNIIEHEHFEAIEIIVKYDSGSKTKTEYYLNRIGFIKCLLSCAKSEIYHNYYMLLERVLKYYFDYQSGYDAKIMFMKDDKIDKLQHTVEVVVNQNNKIVALAEAQGIKLDILKDYNEAIYNHLDDKSFHSTKVPKNPRKQSTFVVYIKDTANGKKFKLVSGQAPYIKKTMNEYEDDDYEIAVEPFYIANGIDLKNNINDMLREKLNQKLTLINTKQKLRTDKKNENLVNEIAEYYEENDILDLFKNTYNLYIYIGNKVDHLLKDDPDNYSDTDITNIKKIITTNKRSIKCIINSKTVLGKFNSKKVDGVISSISNLAREFVAGDINDDLRNIKNEFKEIKSELRDYESEKYTFNKCSITNIGITISNLMITYINNKYVPYNDIIEIIKDVRDETQVNPCEEIKDELE